MGRNLKKRYLLFVWLLSTVSVSAQDQLSFEQARDIMLNNNNLIKAVGKKQDAYSFEEKAATGLRLPTLKAIGSVSIMNKDVTVELAPDKSLVLQKKDIQFLGAELSWAVFTGGKIKSAQRAAKINSAIAANEMSGTKDKLISELADRYFKAKLTIEALRVRIETLQGMDKHLHDAKKLFERGMIPESELLQTKVAVADARRELLGASKDIGLAYSALANTLELDSVNTKLSTPFFIAANLEPLKYYQDLGVANYPDIEKLNLLGKLEETKIAAEKADYFPHISVLAAQIIPSNNFPLLRNPTIAMASLSYTIFNGGQRRNKVRAAEATRQSIGLMEEKAKTDIRTVIRKFYDDLQKQADLLQSLESSLIYSKELLRVRTKAFAEGMSTSVDVIDAQLHLADIELKKLNCYTTYDSTLAKLYEFSGISEEFVHQILTIKQ